MKIKSEKLGINSTPATLFVGVGGIGSDIVTRVAEMCAPGEDANLRFVAMDTNANDLRGVKSSTANIPTPAPRFWSTIPTCWKTCSSGANWTWSWPKAAFPTPISIPNTPCMTKWPWRWAVIIGSLGRKVSSWPT